MARLSSSARPAAGAKVSPSRSTVVSGRRSRGTLMLCRARRWSRVRTIGRGSPGADGGAGSGGLQLQQAHALALLPQGLFQRPEALARLALLPLAGKLAAGRLDAL